jgi:hypothetical protein
LVFAPSANAGARAVADFFRARPDLRAGVIVPDGFFGGDADSKYARSVFGLLVSSRQVEVILPLRGRPVLALVADTDLDRASLPPGTVLPSRFSRPEDVRGQLALARSQFRRAWRVDPAGFLLPWDAVLGPELGDVSRLGYAYALLEAKDEGGWYAGDVPVARPARYPAEKSRREDLLRRWASLPAETRPPLQVATLEELEEVWDWALRREVSFRPVGDRAPGREAGLPPLEGAYAAPLDFSPWIGEPAQNTAWTRLGRARDALDEYRDSGRANLRSLDLAMKEMYNAESGVYFYHMGSRGDAARRADSEREFSATLGQVYRLIGREEAAASGEGEPASGAFFHREGSVLSWRDPAGDDRGPGNYFYPTGRDIPAGAWDLRVFAVEADAGEVRLKVEMTDLANPGGAPNGFSLPLVDIYIDLNHLAGAGSTTLLPGRPGLFEPADAWEYAVTASGHGGRLYRASSDVSPRFVSAGRVVKVSPTVFQVALPRSVLGGDPEEWGFAVMVMGYAGEAVPGSVPQPLPVKAEPGPRQFGGAAAGGIPAPPFADILAPEGARQEKILGSYRRGEALVFPMARVRAD